MSYKEYCDSDVAKTVSVVAAVAGFIGLSYFAYKKRDNVDWKGLKYKANRILTPIGIGARASGQEFKHYANDWTQKSLSDTHSSLHSVFDKLDEKVSSMKGDARDKYVQEIKYLRSRLHDLLPPEER